MSTSNGITTSKRKDSLPSLSPASLKKRRVLEEKSQNINTPPSVVHQSRGLKPSSQNIKSSFEEDLNRLTQEIGEVGDTPFETDQKWNRPEVKPFNPEKDSFTFQQIESEEAMDNGAPSIRLFGVTDAGNSVMCHVTGFLPYFYIPAPIGFQRTQLQALQVALERSVSRGQPVIHHVEISMRENLWGYNGNQKTPFLKIILHDPKNLARVRVAFEQGEVQFLDMFQGPTLTFESNIQFLLRFMIDTKIVGMNWVELPCGKYSVRTGGSKISNCQIECQISYRDIISHTPEGEWAKIAPLRVLSFDIECAGRPGVFPEATIDPVIQIANVVTTYGSSKPFIRNVFTIDTCSQIVGAQVLEHSSQESLLMAWKEFLLQVDPDVMIGYNIANFDLPYLLDRARACKLDEKFPFLGRISRNKSVVKNTTFASKAFGQRDSKETTIDGRLQLDMLQVMQRDYKLRSYSLNAVCANFLGEQKEDVHHSIITELHNGTAESRRRLAVYCLKDAYLPQRLMDKLMSFVNYTEMARVTGVPFNYLLARGQQIKVISQLYRKARTEGFVIPNLKSEGSDEQYEGATVIEPRKGYYSEPVATLDFSSLYPSIMQAHNLCYTTLLTARTIERLGLKKDEDYIVTPNNDCFVKHHLRKGILPTILADLLAARKQAKADLKKETDPFKKAVLDGRQLALKISANSVYGFTGATIGKLPCLAISSSTTSYGRQMIEKTKELVEQRYTKANGYDHDATVIYGDTDSVMVLFGPSEIAKCMEMGTEAANYVSGQFINPIKLEFEKVYYPYLLISKKRYAGLYWTNPDKYDKMDAKGIETVRRDNCMLVQTVIDTALRKMLIDKDVEGAQEYTKNIIADLLQNKVDMSQLVITKALSKADYANKQPHVELAEKMRKRDPGASLLKPQFRQLLTCIGSAPALGDRVAYVIVKGARGDQFFKRSEDPIFVLENNIPLDTQYYLENQLSKPLLRIFEPILHEKANLLLAGDHTRTISVAAPTVGGLMKFAVKTQTCLGCKTPLPKGVNDAVCPNCISRAGELYQKQLVTINELEMRFSRLWTQCQRCQGSLHQDVICTSSDCPIYYRRIKAQKDLAAQVPSLERFDMEW